MHPTERPVVAFAILVLGSAAVLSPVLDPGRDGFPLSPYPMFSSKKDGKTRVHHAVALLDAGGERVLAPRYLGTDEVLQAEVTLARAVRGGKSKTRALCATVAERVALAGDVPARGVEIRSVTYDSVRFFTEPGTPPEGKVLRARCAVTR